MSVVSIQLLLLRYQIDILDLFSLNESLFSTYVRGFLMQILQISHTQLHMYNIYTPTDHFIRYTYRHSDVNVKSANHVAATTMHLGM